MGSFAALLLFATCLVGLLVLGMIFAVIRFLFGWRYRRWGYPPGYYAGPRPFFSWWPGFFFGWPSWRRPFFGPYREFRHYEHMEHMHHHHPYGGHHGGWGGGHHGGWGGGHH